MNEKQYVRDVRNLTRALLDIMLEASRQPTPSHYEERLALLDTLEETIMSLRESWEEDEDEEE